ncbi:MAG: hypothetical protein HQL06_03140 [Nitrospirae bacterium]|nr:hypothetical protein [Nitrospirota bacterium]
MTKILIIRSTSFQLLDRVLARLKAMYPQSEISLLTHQHGKLAAEKYTDVNHVYVYPYTDAFSLFRLPNELEQQRFDVVIVPVGNITGSGFLNVFLFSLRLKTEKRLLCNIALDFTPLSSLKITAILLRNSVFMIIAGGLTVVASVLFLLFWLSTAVSSKKSANQ